MYFLWFISITKLAVSWELSPGLSSQMIWDTSGCHCVWQQQDTGALPSVPKGCHPQTSTLLEESLSPGYQGALVNIVTQSPQECTRKPI